MTILVYHSIRYMSKKIPITNLYHFTDWSATQSENSSIRFDISSKIHSARAAQTAWQNRSERCWKMDNQRPSNAWTRFALGNLGGTSSPPKINIITVGGSECGIKKSEQNHPIFQSEKVYPVSKLSYSFCIPYPSQFL